MMDIEHYFGKAVANRMEPPARDPKTKEPVFSSTIQSFYYHIRDAIKKGKKFIYVLDSQDALTSAASIKKFDQQMKASEEGEEDKIKGSYGDGKAKIHSENIRWVRAGLQETGSILIIIGQTRENLGFGFDKKTRAGGKALRFYANLEIWTSVGEKIKKTVRGAKRTVGVHCLAEVRKNRVTGKVGKDRSVTIPIHYGFGIDDIGSCIDFLTTNGHWSKVKSQEGTRYKAHDLEFNGSRKEIIAYVEKEGLEPKLRAITANLWREIEAECQLVGRKRRYV